MKITNAENITFNYSKEDTKLFDKSQKEYWGNIEKYYQELRKKCLEEIRIESSGTHKEWIRSRVKLHETTSLMRLLYLMESFCDVCLKYNSVAAAANVKAMVEVPLHLGYLVWVLYSHTNFQDIREELSKIAFGNRSKTTSLTTSSKISQKDFYSRSDEMVRTIFKDQKHTVNIFEILYKEGNAIGHHNYEGRNILTGLQRNETWEPVDRKEHFVFLSNKIFQFFLYCDMVASITSIFTNAIEHYLDELPEYFDS